MSHQKVKKITKMTIIIADDSLILRTALKSMFSTCRNIKIVGEATNGYDAVRIIHDLQPDFAIVDIRMPEMNGIEVLRKVKQMNSRTKICILTNYAYKQYCKVCIDEGAFKFFDKNKDLQLMRDTIFKSASEEDNV
jgi:two-component system, NarL family, response regulator DegU